MAGCVLRFIHTWRGGCSLSVTLSPVLGLYTYHNLFLQHLILPSRLIAFILSSPHTHTYCTYLSFLPSVYTIAPYHLVFCLTSFQSVFRVRGYHLIPSFSVVFFHSYYKPPSVRQSPPPPPLPLDPFDSLLFLLLLLLLLESSCLLFINELQFRRIKKSPRWL